MKHQFIDWLLPCSLIAAIAAAERRGQPSLSAKARGWRKQPPSDKQIIYAQRLRVFQPGMTKGACAAAITRAITLRRRLPGGIIP